MTIQIPENVTKKLYVCIGTGEFNENSIDIFDFEPVNDSKGNFQHIVLTTHEVSVDIPKNIDVIGVMVDTLVKEKEKLIESHQLKMMAIDQKINDLLALPAPGHVEEV